ncbi:unnamed protein product [Darwinula stevensoni]|uniref:Neutral ceramidase n=1 Tax=Darwinula stevensoni TaxID=69355 RepID=A0A7R9A775_9CRUS|nr:unnamed protein product [Darwinula stevensoni]CAG0890551.1 unnamed protein product [Darwinula stevensoni]
MECLKFVVGTFLLLLSTPARCDEDGLFWIGVGIADCTGPAAGIGLVVRRLQEEFGGIYHQENVILSGTHTHSGPAGFLQYLLFQITSLGFSEETYNANVDGIVNSIRAAHGNLQPGNVYYNEGELLEANVNRSPISYLNNPPEERVQYEYDVDKILQLLKFQSLAGDPLAMFTWFPVHATSMNNTNKLLSGDNKGVASMIVEAAFNPGALPGKGSFVAGFAASNLGDVSPNIKGPRCIDTGEPCDPVTSACGGTVGNCIAFGPGDNMEESTWIIGERQANKAMELFEDVANLRLLTGTVKYVHQFVDMTNVVVERRDIFGHMRQGRTCKPAMGYSFAAGTTDGPGMFDFTQGETDTNPFWDFVADFIQDPTPEQVACHAPKPILLDTGEIGWPYLWQPEIVDTQIGLIGDLAIAAVPGEFTTMSGRRLRNDMTQVLESHGAENPTVVIAGLSNTYSDYITTYEEYQASDVVQRYEAGSTIYGPHTLQAYLNQYVYILESVLSGATVPPGPTPPDLLDKMLIIPPVLFDTAPGGTDFGDCTVPPPATVNRGDVIRVDFITGHPRNNVRHGDTFLAVERLLDTGEWERIAVDANWETNRFTVRTLQGATMECLKFVVGTFLLVSTPARCDEDGLFRIGVGIADCTGPAAGIGLMGYANPSQTGAGIHMRQFARTFIICDDPGECLVFVIADMGMMDTAVKTGVVRRLQEEFGGIYHQENVILSGTHTHSGTAGFLQYLLFQITNLGFSEETYNANVDGIVNSIRAAHGNLQPGHVYYNEGELLEANVNRSPISYLNNPPEERAQYEYDVDKILQLLKFQSLAGDPLAMFTWFPVHATSMNNTNKLLSGDNKGVASMIVEAAFNPGALPGKGSFVAGFAASNLGDVSPNIKGPRCIDTGEPCDPVTSACGGTVGNCIAFGPGDNMEESTWIIGERQANKALELFEDTANLRLLTGMVKYVHQFVDMTNVVVERRDIFGHMREGRTCKPAMGYSFAAGTTDGPGMFDFTQGETDSNPFWNFVTDLIQDPTPEQVACHAPKPILLDTGENGALCHMAGFAFQAMEETEVRVQKKSTEELSDQDTRNTRGSGSRSLLLGPHPINRTSFVTRIGWPYLWQPEIVDTQIGLIGDLAIAAVPGEFTTMSGRRLRNDMTQVLESHGAENPTVVIAGLSNTYSDYITTYEEYQASDLVQRYEAGSTIYGPHTLQAYLNQYVYLLESVLSGATVPPGPTPPDLLDEMLTFIPPVLFDTAPGGTDFGDCTVPPPATVNRGDVIRVDFITGHPRNNVRHGDTFLAVERLLDTGEWERIAVDANWETKYEWENTNFFLGESVAHITWHVPADATPGTYKIRHFGEQKDIFKAITSFEGECPQFQVV